MTTLLHFCQSQQSARLVLRPESGLAVPTCALWVSSMGVLSSDWNCLSGVDGDHGMLLAGASTVRRLSGGLRGHEVPPGMSDPS